EKIDESLDAQIAGALKNSMDATSRIAAALCLADSLPPTTHGKSQLEKLLAARLLLAGIDSAERDALLAAASRRPSLVLDEAATFDGKPTARGLLTLESFARNYAANGGDDYLPEILRGMANKDSNPEIASAILAGLASGWPAKLSAKAADLGGEVGELLPKLSASSRAKLIRLATIWGVKGLDAQLAELTKAAYSTIADAKAADAERIEAAKQIVEFQPESADAVAKLLEVITPQASPAVATGIIEALGQSKAVGLGIAITAKLKDLSPAVRPAAIRLVLAKADSAKAFLDAVEKGSLRFDMLALDQKTALAAHADRTIAERARKLLAQGGGLPNADRQKVIEEMRPLLKQTGDPASGKKVFAAQCAKCHQHSGEGTAIGPDLTGMSVHPKEELLIHILDP